MEENDRIWGKKVIVDPGDSQIFEPGQIVTARKLRDENSSLKRRDLKPVKQGTRFRQQPIKSYRGLHEQHCKPTALCLLHRSRKPQSAK